MKKRLFLFLLTVGLAVCLAAALSGTAKAEKPVIDTITITSDIEAPVVDCYPMDPNVTITPDEVTDYIVTSRWQRLESDGAFHVLQNDKLVTEGTYRYQYGLKVEASKASLANSLTVVINGKSQIVNSYTLEDGSFKFVAYSDVYTAQTLPKPPGTVRLSPDSYPLYVGQKLSCVFSDGAEKLDQSTFNYRWECRDRDTGRVFGYQSDQGYPTCYLHNGYEGYDVRARIYVKGYSGFLDSDWHPVENKAAVHTVTVIGGTTNKPTAKVDDFVTINYQSSDSSVVFDHWEVVSGGKIDLVSKDTEKATFYMPDTDLVIKAVTKEAPTLFCTITFNANGGTGSMDSMVLSKGDWLYFPECTFTPPAGATFVGWKISYLDTIYHPGNSTTIYNDVIYYAVWKGGSMDTGGTITHLVNTNALNVRAKPDAGSDRIGGLKYGDLVTLLDSDGEWFQINCRGMIGWVQNKYLDRAPYGEWKYPFTDITVGSYDYVPILWAYNAKPQVTNGMDDTHFGPGTTVTRGQCAAFLWRAMGEPEPTITKNPFVDVPASQYYYKPILWAVEKGVTKGTDATHFSPDQTLSTAHIITFLYRTLGIGSDGWYQEAGNWAKNNGLMDRTGLTVDPGTDCPRGAVVTFLYRTK